MKECMASTYFENGRFHAIGINKPLAERHIDGIEFFGCIVQDVARHVGKRCIFVLNCWSRS